MGTFESFRKAYGALKDSTMVGLAKVNSEFKELDIAIVKATNHVELPPKERHVRKIFSATSVVRPRADVAYCIRALSKRLSKTKNWIVALKTLIVIHRTLREGDPTFREELLNYSPRGYIIQMSHFKDDSSPLAWDCSAWVRTYAQFIEERLECFRVLRYDIETERLTKTSLGGSSKAHSRTRLLSNNELLLQLPALQRLLYRLIGCQPEGAAYCNNLIQYALALVLKESFKIYCAINDGIINLVDMFFDMPRYDAVKALEIYRRAGHQAENLAEFYDYCKRLEVARNFQFPMLRHPPPSFLTTMEEYIREAPQPCGSMSSKRPEEYHEVEKEVDPPQPQESAKEPPEEEKELINFEEEPKKEKEEPEAPPPPLPLVEEAEGDLLGLSDQVNHLKVLELEQSNAMALAIVTRGGTDHPSSSSAYNNNSSSSWDLVLGSSGSGWELALVTTPSNNTHLPVETKLGGGFDKLLLDSLYEDEAARRRIQLTHAGYGFRHGHGEAVAAAAPNPFDQPDPFTASNNIAAPTNVQMAQQQQQQQQQQMMFQMQQQQYPYLQNHPYQYEEQQRSTNMNMNLNMMMLPYHHQQQQSPPPPPNYYYYPQQSPNPQHPNNSNPFGDSFPSFTQAPLRPPHHNHYLL